MSDDRQDGIGSHAGPQEPDAPHRRGHRPRQGHRQAGGADHRRQADHRPAGHDLARSGHGAGHPHSHALLPRGLVPGRRVPHLRRRDRRPADARRRRAVTPITTPDPGLHAHAEGPPRPPPHPRPARWPATTATAAPACATTTASCRRWRRNTASISTASATWRRRATRSTRSSYSVVRDINKCVLCRRCIRTCIDLQEVGVLEAIDRGNRTRVSTFMEKPLADVICINCGQCSNRCPTGALQANDATDDVWAAIDDPERHVVIQTAPSPRAAIGECFGLPPGRALTFELNTALRGCGFDKVFDTNFAADLTIIEEGDRAARAAAPRVGRRRPDGRAAAVHQLLARLGQVPRTLLSGILAPSLHGQEPAADVRHAAEDLLRRAQRPRPGRRSSPWR